MKHARVSSLAIVALCAFCAASAHAALPEYGFTLPETIKSKAVGLVFENEGASLSVKCTEAEGAFEIKTVKQLIIDELWLGCEAALEKVKLGKCTGSADTTSGSILAKGTSTLGYALGTLIPLVALPVEEMKFKCPLGTVVTVKGCLAGTTTLAKGLTATVKYEEEKGAQKFTDYTNDKGEAVPCQLESSVNGAAFKPSALAETATWTFTKEASVLD